MRLACAVAIALVLSGIGCHSRVVILDVKNNSEQPLNTIIVDYPGATFGINSLDPGKSYHYAIKPLDTGALKIQFSDAAGKNHKFAGPALHKNQEGSIKITLTQSSISAEPRLM